MAKKVFLDVGACAGESALFWRTTHPQGQEFEIHSFECDPKNLATLRAMDAKHGLDVIVVDRAAWIDATPRRFYYGTTSLAGTLFPSKITGGICSSRFYDVAAVDLADYMREHCVDADQVVVKLNCEGAEYPIIRHLHAQGLIPGVFRWYVQWHYRKIKMSKDEHQAVASLLPRWFCWEMHRGQKFVDYFLNSLKE